METLRHIAHWMGEYLWLIAALAVLFGAFLLKSASRYRGSAPAPAPDRASPPRLDDTIAKSRRYANASLYNHLTSALLDPLNSFEPSQVVVLELNIGFRSLRSHVIDDTSFPTHAISGDTEIRVLVSSSDFMIAPAGANAFRQFGNGDSPPADGYHAEGYLFLLESEGVSVNGSDGGPSIRFHLRAPSLAGRGYCRIGYYAFGTLVHSQQLSAFIGIPGGFEIKTDFTLTTDFSAIENFRSKPRMSLLTNANGDGMHQIVLRTPMLETETGQRAGPRAATFRVNGDEVAKRIKEMRSILTEYAPTQKKQKKATLVSLLRKLAPCGWELCLLVPAKAMPIFHTLRHHPDSFVVQVARPTTSDFVFPWSLIYEIALPAGQTPRLCPLVETWDGDTPLIKETMRTCPFGPHVDGVLCPFGFWGFRYSIEQCSSSENIVQVIDAHSNPEFVICETLYEVNEAQLNAHVRVLEGMFQRHVPNGKVLEGKSKRDIHRLLDHDIPLVYFYCHGARDEEYNRDTVLGVGKNERISGRDVVSWILSWSGGKKLVWDKIRPLIFINACHSLDIEPRTLVSYLEAFVGTGNAAGVIGTEVKVHQQLAMEVAERFYDLLLREKQTVDSALRQIRFDWLAHGNLLGLVYTPYCRAELQVMTRPTSNFRPLH